MPDFLHLLVFCMAQFCFPGDSFVVLDPVGSESFSKIWVSDKIIPDPGSFRPEMNVNETTLKI